MIRNAWYVVARSDEVETRDLQGHVIAGRPLVIWRTDDGEVVALDARCAHKRFPLWEGKLLPNGSLECAYHGFAYNDTGRCVAIPALHDASDRIPITAAQRKYQVSEHDGLVWVWPGDAEPIECPRTPELDSDSFESRWTGQMEVAANQRLLIENLFDLTHFYPLHADNIGSLGDAMVPVQIERGDTYLKTTRVRENFSTPPMTRDRFGLDVADQIQEHTMVGPGLFHVFVRVAPPGKIGTDEERSFVLYQSITPVDDGRLIWRRYTACKAGSRWSAQPDRPLVDAIVAGAPKVIEQDRWAIERQQEMFAFPDEWYREVHVKTDGAVVMARKMLDDLEEGEQYAQVRSQAARTQAKARRGVGTNV